MQELEGPAPGRRGGRARAPARSPTLRCLIVGGIHRLGAEYGERLKERIAAPDLAGHVVLTGARRDVAACMDAMDVVVHASNREPFGRVLLEAMAASRPVIAPREGGPLEIVADGETGVLVPPRDPDALAAAIVSLLEDPTRARRDGARRARARRGASSTSAQHARAVEAVFDDVLRRAPRSRGMSAARKVLVLGKSDSSFLTVIRSLGRQGIEVHIAWCPPIEVARRSRYVRVVHELPGLPARRRRVEAGASSTSARASASIS